MISQMEEQTGMIDKKQFMEVMKNIYDIYIEHGARSKKNVNQ